MKTTIQKPFVVSAIEAIVAIASGIKSVYKSNEQGITFATVLVAAMAYDTRPIVCFGLIAIAAVMCANFTKEEEDK